MGLMKLGVAVLYNSSPFLSNIELFGLDKYSDIIYNHFHRFFGELSYRKTVQMTAEEISHK